MLGELSARARDAARLVWWMQVRFVHCARHSTPTGRATSAVLAVTWWPVAPLLVLLQAALIRNGWTRYYLAPHRDAVLAVTAISKGWRVGDHASARPRTGTGRALRDLVLPTLLPLADPDQIPLVTVAVAPALAEADAR